MNENILDLYDDPIKASITKDMVDTIRNLLDDSRFNNNQRASILAELFVDVHGFIRVGTGTNRVVFRKNDIVFKIPLDQCGVVDNRVEYAVSTYEVLKEHMDLPNMARHLTNTFDIAYEGLVVTAEYITVLMTVDDFKDAKNEILEIADDATDFYLFDDIGYLDRNFKNFGRDDDGKLKVLDYGYLKPLDTIDLNCPECHIGFLRYNKKFTKLVCNSPDCEEKYRPFSIFRNYEEPASEFEEDEFGSINDDEFIDDRDLEGRGVQELLEEGYPFYRIYDVYVNAGIERD